jgi:hypothetical protein
MTVQLFPELLTLVAIWIISWHLVFKIHVPTVKPPALPNIIYTEASASIPWALNFNVNTPEGGGNNLAKYKYASQHLHKIQLPFSLHGKLQVTGNENPQM